MLRARWSGCTFSCRKFESAWSPYLLFSQIISGFFFSASSKADLVKGVVNGQSGVAFLIRNFSAVCATKDLLFCSVALSVFDTGMAVLCPLSLSLH